MGRFSALFIIGLLTLCTGGWVFILLVPVFGGFSTWFFGLITTVFVGEQADEMESGPYVVGSDAARDSSIDF